MQIIKINDKIYIGSLDFFVYKNFGVKKIGFGAPKNSYPILDIIFKLYFYLYMQKTMT